MIYDNINWCKLKKPIVYCLFLLLIISCDKFEALKKCKDHKDKDCLWFDLNTDRNCFERPCFNPRNSNEFVCIQRKNDTISLVKYNLNTKEKKILLHHFPILGQIEWGKSGWIVFYTYIWKIWKIRDNGSELSQLTFGANDQHPVFNQDGNLIIYPRLMDYSNGQLMKKPELYLLYKMIVIDLSGNIIDSFCRAFENASCYPWRHCSWQKDEFLAEYGPNNNGTKWGLAVYDLNGNELRVLFDDNKYQVLRDMEWVWGTNDIIYSADEDGLTSFKNGKKHKLRDYCNEEWYNYFTISRDGKKILAEKSYGVLIDKCLAEEHKVLVIMDIDGDNEKEIEIPE